MKKKILLVVLFVLALSVGGFFYFRYQVYFSEGRQKNTATFEITKGEGNKEIAKDLEDKSIISSRFYLYYYLKMNDLTNRIMPGDYLLSGKMTIPEVVQIITSPQMQVIKITFPEGLTVKDMAELLKKNNFDGDGFLRLVNDPVEFKNKYAFLADPKITTLEGYLFPDTYFFKKDYTGRDIIARMLDNFSRRVNDKILADIKDQEKTLREMVIMASITEKEVASASDMKTVSGIFWNRIANDMPLQSDAPLSYILDDNNAQHTLEQLKINSPYNTYTFKGLPPGPISNPGLQAIQSAVSPEKTDYNFFFTVGKGADRKTIFSKTFEEHAANRAKYGV